jgi:integrase
VKKKVKEREKGFDGEEAAKILAATQGPFSHLISVEMRAARRWLPWIGAYTGARINELTPLTAANFVKRDGIWMIRIRGASAKTRTYRKVPLHGHLIEQGLLDYAKSRGKRPLFYDPARSRGAKDSNPHHQKVAERIGEWVRSLGIEGVAPNMAGATAFPASPASSACPRTSATSSRVTPERRSPTTTARPGRSWRCARSKNCRVTWSEAR